MPAQHTITLKNVYEMVVDLKHDMDLIKKNFLEEPELRDEFILRMKDIDIEKTVMVEDFSKKYGLT